ncbi:hypothetical protein [Salinifilum ghardaiensis]
MAIRYDETGQEMPSAHATSEVVISGAVPPPRTVATWTPRLAPVPRTSVKNAPWG